MKSIINELMSVGEMKIRFRKVSCKFVYKKKKKLLTNTNLARPMFVDLYTRDRNAQ